jgi:signal transduction histidine kinase
LGLSICRKLVEAMGSSLRVETTMGTGTRFFFELELPLAGEGQFG